jgi:hypothetical protein
MRERRIDGGANTKCACKLLVDLQNLQWRRLGGAAISR